jgi:hypothetical protein
MWRMTAEVHSVMADSVTATAASASCHVDALLWVNQLANFQALSKLDLNSARLCSCEAPGKAMLQMCSAQARRSAFLGGSSFAVHGRARCAALAKLNKDSRHLTPIAW